MTACKVLVCKKLSRADAKGPVHVSIYRQCDSNDQYVPKISMSSKDQYPSKHYVSTSAACGKFMTRVALGSEVGIRRQWLFRGEKIAILGGGDRGLGEFSCLGGKNRAVDSDFQLVLSHMQPPHQLE
jgi:hypothetical protein